MTEDTDGGDHTNAVYYEQHWTKQIKVRVYAKRVKPKRYLKKSVHLGDMPVGIVKHLRRLHDKRIHPSHAPLFR